MSVSIEDTLAKIAQEIYNISSRLTKLESLECESMNPTRYDSERHRSKSTSNGKKSICRLHFKFGKSARRCVSPNTCVFIKNNTTVQGNGTPSTN